MLSTGKGYQQISVPLFSWSFRSTPVAGCVLTYDGSIQDAVALGSMITSGHALHARALGAQDRIGHSQFNVQGLITDFAHLRDPTADDSS